MAKEQQFIVAGYVRHPDGSPAEGVTIRVSDVDFRSEQPLGEALTDEKGLYKIPYTADQFRRAEKKSADLVARAYKDGVLRAESEIHYNVGQKEQINLTLKPMDEAPPRELTELEALLAAIEPVTGDAAAATFSDQEIRFLGEELRRCQPSRLLELLEREILQQILEFLRQADRLARETGIACDAYYGMFRQDLPSELDALLDQPLKNMREALEQAIEEKIIPDITAQLPDILERLRALRFSRGRLVRQRFVGRLLDDETGKPLRGHLVTAVDLDAEAEEQQLGSVTTDGRGRFAVNLSVPAGTPEEAIRRLRFNIFDDGLSVAEAEIEAKIKQEKVAEVRVHVREDERGDVPIADVASPALTARLAERGIHNLRDLLNKPDEKDEDDPEGLERARGAATWAVLAPELDDEKRAALLDEGLFSPLDVSAISRANFVRGFSERLGGDAAAYATYVGADEATKVLYNAIGSAWLADVNGSNDDPDNPDFPPGVVETLGSFKTCGCKDCDSAVSPAAYLAHLLGWTLKHLKDGEASITLSQLSEGEHSLHQPFGDIVADCQAVEEQVRQVRIACEELWRFNDWLLLSDQNLPFPVRTSYRQLRNELYRTILTNLGVPFAQLHKAVLVIESDNLAAETIAEQRRAVAERLGIDEVHLNTLFFDVDLDTGLTLVSPTEAELQTLFGYESTRRLDVFEPIPQPDLITWQRERLETIWREQDWFVPSDPYRGPNRRPFVEPEVITEAYLRELADNPALVLLEARQETLALHRQAMIATNPQDNGLAGFVALVEGELGQSIDQLEALYDTLQSGEDAEPEEIEQAHDAIIALNLTLAGFTFLMETHAHLANDEPLGLTEEEIETLQRLIRGVYTQEHLEELQHLEFDPEEIYELEWPVLGSYLTWRAFMLVYLYPENALSYSPYPRQSFGFSEYIKKALPAGGVIPAQACAAADAYSAYYQDVCQLEVQASCQVATAVSTIGNCEPTQSKPRQLVHLFGLTVDSGSVYTNYYDPYFETKDTLTSWRPLNKLQGVAQIIGAVPHETSTGMRYILLFVKVKEGPHFALHFVKYDLDRLEWGSPSPLDLPPGTGKDFTAVAIQKRYGSITTLGLQLTSGEPPTTANMRAFPTVLAIRASDGFIYLRSVKNDATNWSAEGWFPLFGPELAAKTTAIECLIQRDDKEYVIFCRRENLSLYYRFLYIDGIGDDDGKWRIALENSGTNYAGGFAWPGLSDVYFFINESDEGPTYLHRMGKTGNLNLAEDITIKTDIFTLNDWLETTAGVSLKDFLLPKNFTIDFFAPAEDPGTHDPRHPPGIDKEIEEVDVTYAGYNGNLYNLLTLHPDDFYIGFDTTAAIFKVEKYYLAQLIHAVVELFLDHISTINKVSYLHKDLGKWKLADLYLRRFSLDKVLLAQAVDDLSDNREVMLMQDSVPGFLDPASTFTFGIPNKKVEIRDRKDEVITDFPPMVSSHAWQFVAGDGEEAGPDDQYKTVVVVMNTGYYRLHWRRLDDGILDAKTPYPLRPRGHGPYDLLPESSRSALQLRKLDVQEMYEQTGSQPSVVTYVKEAYNLVPIYLGRELQRNGYYEEALLWYRQVYDYLQPIGWRKIDYSLTLEESLTLNYEDAEEWLDDASNPHAIAATRKNTYTRQVLLLIIRCLIDYAAAMFSHDNVTDNARARELYTLALKLLAFEELRPGESPCADILGELEIEVIESPQIPLQQFQAALAQIPDSVQLQEVASAVRTINQETDRPLDERIEEMRDIVVAAIAQIPPPKRFNTVLQVNRHTANTMEKLFLAHHPSRKLLHKTQKRGREKAMARLAGATGISVELLLDENLPNLAWLRQPSANGNDTSTDDNHLELALFNPAVPRRLSVLSDIRVAAPLASLTAAYTGSVAINTSLSFGFCIPQNPVVNALRSWAENNLTKLRTCRNIAGFLRQLDPYGAPIGIGSGLISADGTIFSGIVEALPIPYRYPALINRAKELVNIAQQIEAGYQTALEKAENKAYNALVAEQGVELANVRVVLQDLRVNQANTELGLAQLQKDSAVFREGTYAGWIAAGKNEHEQNLLTAYRDAGVAQRAANAFEVAGQVAGLTAELATHIGAKNILTTPIGTAVYASAKGAQIGAVIDAGIFNDLAIAAQTNAQIASFEASFERQNNEWQLQQGLAALDVQIGDQQIQLAQDGIAIAQQERVIVGLEQTHAVPSELPASQGFRRGDVSLDRRRPGGCLSLLLAIGHRHRPASRTAACF